MVGIGEKIRNEEVGIGDVIFLFLIFPYIWIVYKRPCMGLLYITSKDVHNGGK